MKRTLYILLICTAFVSAFAQSSKTTPPDQTNAEQFYYSKQMQGKTHMVVVLTDGEQLEGVIEGYDKD